MALKFVNGARLPKGAEPEAVQAEIEKLYTRYGGVIEAKHIVSAARPKRSPLHVFFEWDDTAAAEHWRLAQAAYLLRVVVFIPETEDGDGEPVRANIAVRMGGEAQPAAFMRVHDAMSLPEVRASVLLRLQREVQRAQSQLASYKAYAALVPVLDEALAAIETALGAG